MFSAVRGLVPFLWMVTRFSNLLEKKNANSHSPLLCFSSRRLPIPEVSVLCLSAPRFSLVMSQAFTSLLMRPPSSISDRSFPSSALSPSGNHLCNLFFIFNHFQFPAGTKQAEVIDRRVSCRHTCYTRLPCFAKCIRGKNWPCREWLFFPLDFY